MAPEMQDEAQGVTYFVNCDTCGVIESGLSLNHANHLAHQHNIQNFDHYAQVIIDQD
jgi:hypothetical protein